MLSQLPPVIYRAGFRGIPVKENCTIGVHIWNNFLKHFHKDAGQVVLIHAMKAYTGKGGIAPHILNLSIAGRWVVNLTSQPLCSRERAPRYALKKGLGRPWSRSGSFGNVNTLPAPAFGPPHVQTAAQSLYRLPVEGGAIFWLGFEEGFRSVNFVNRSSASCCL